MENPWRGPARGGFALGADQAKRASNRTAGGMLGIWGIEQRPPARPPKEGIVRHRTTRPRVHDHLAAGNLNVS
jgi:hypothetical protein